MSNTQAELLPCPNDDCESGPFVHTKQSGVLQHKSMQGQVECHQCGMRGPETAHYVFEMDPARATATATRIATELWNALPRLTHAPVQTEGEDDFGDLVNSCFKDIGDAEPFVVERKEEFLGAWIGTSHGSCTQLSAWLVTNKDHPIVAAFLARALPDRFGEGEKRDCGSLGWCRFEDPQTCSRHEPLQPKDTGK